MTDFSDLLTLAKHYNAGAANADVASMTSDAFAADFALAQSLVPEPGVIGVVIALIAPVAARRR